jgi:hypothetical protein
VSNQFTVVSSFSAYDNRTIEADIAVTNNDPTNTLAKFQFQNLSLNLPGPVTQQSSLTVNQYNGTPVSFLSGTWGSVALWQGTYPTAAQQSSNCCTSTPYLANAVSNYTSWGPDVYSTPIPPGKTQVFKQFVRFGSSTDTATSLAPEAYTAYRAAQPYLLNWPDRRPIAQWLISDAYNGRSKTNPRGYLWDNTIDITNKSAFQTKVLANANSVLKNLNAMTPKPQGIIVWDLEGQEFNQSFTYVGYPNNLPLLAPEMDAIADQLMAVFKSAGYRVGVTIRPNYFGAGNFLPTTCAYNSNIDFADKFVNTSATYPNRGYNCTAPNVWTAAAANSPSVQSEPQDYNTALNLLSSKINYARSRWGATLFYIDSTVWEGGTPLDASIFRTLQAKFPDCLLIPEESTDLTFGAAAPLEQAAALGYYGTSQRTKNLYPGAFGVLNMANANWTTNRSTLVQAVASGDILMFEGWWAAPEIPVVQQIYSSAGVH